MNLVRSVVLWSTALLLLSPPSTAATNDLTLWYRQPGRDWNEALPVGNGRLGAMVFGGPTTERLQLNEDSLWSGSPQDADNPAALEALPEIRRLLFAGKYAEAQAMANHTLVCRGAGSGQGRGARAPYGSYQTLADLILTFGDRVAGNPGTNAPVENFRRELDLAQAIAGVTYRQAGIAFQREVFSSHPDQVLAIRLTASAPASLNLQLRLTRSEMATTRLVGAAQLLMLGQMHDGQGTNGMKFAVRLLALPEGGQVVSVGDALRIEKADAVTLLVAAATDYTMQRPDWRQGDPAASTAARLQSAAAKSYAALRGAHVADHRASFDRVQLDLGATDTAELPTDARLKAVTGGAFDPGLIALYFQYGRYLLLGSSRPGAMPANLQGIWADGIETPWNCDYHANINLQMNYWPVDVANLGECFEPLERYITFLSGPGARTANVHYGARGWTVHTITNPWGFTSPGESPSWGLSPSAGAWLSQHLWEHFAFTRDTNFLRRVFPVLRGSAEFSLDWLVPDPKTGRLLAGPATSPENMFITADGQRATLCMGPAMEQQLVWDAFVNYLEAARILGANEPTLAAVEQALSRLGGPQVGHDGRLMEWSEEFREAEPGHRHVSHLFALHPGRQITLSGTPELAAAARKSLEARLAGGGGHTGWSRAWIINFWARLGDGEKAGENVQALLAKSTLPNLFDTHPPFQIDGNFGGTAGIAEMLLQSQARSENRSSKSEVRPGPSGDRKQEPGISPSSVALPVIDLLPALPKSWATGSVRGLRARGAITVDLDWAAGQLVRATLRPDHHGRCVVRHGTDAVELTLEAGGDVALDARLHPARNLR